MGPRDVDVIAGRRWLGPVLEGAVALGAMTLFLVLASSIRIDPLQRIGQVSGLASLQLRFMLLAVPAIVAAIVAARWRGGAYFSIASRLACATLAGLASAFVAGGIMVALRNTPYCLNAHSGDAEMLGIWANGIKGGPFETPPPLYPPLFPHLLRYYMDLVDLPALYALKHLQIGVTALMGPLAYLCWRLVLRPGWALGIGIVATLVVIEPYKPYENLALACFVPVLIKFMSALRSADERTIHQLAKSGVLFGLGFGVLALTYSGWFRWSAPGAVVAAAIVFPWRGGRWKSGALLLAATALAFGAVTFNYATAAKPYVAAAATGSSPATALVADDYIYFDVVTDPAYFAMWKGDMPGDIQAADWPPPGELAGIGLYGVLAFVGFGAAIALARKRSAVIALTCVVLGTWLMRMWYAHKLYETHFVQLFPRTSIQLAYLFVAIGGFAVYYAVELVARRTADSVLRKPGALIGGLAGLAFVLATAGSAIANRYMPYNSIPRTLGILSFVAHDATKQHVPPDPP